MADETAEPTDIVVVAEGDVDIDGDGVPDAIEIEELDISEVPEPGDA